MFINHVMASARQAIQRAPVTISPVRSFTSIDQAIKLVDWFKSYLDLNPAALQKVASATISVAIPVGVLWYLYQSITDDKKESSFDAFSRDWGSFEQKAGPLTGSEENDLERSYYNIRRSQLFQELMRTCILTRNYFDFSTVWRAVYGVPNKNLATSYCTPLIHVYGRRGDGKSSLVGEVLQDYMKRYRTSFVWRIPVESEQGLIKELLKLAHFFGLAAPRHLPERGLIESEESYKSRILALRQPLIVAITKHLKLLSRRGEWILVFDFKAKEVDTRWLLNLLDPPADAGYNYWRDDLAGKGKVFILSPQTKPIENLDWKVVNISLAPGFSLDEVKEFISQELKEFEESDQEALVKIADLVSFSPLAIHTAILYAKQIQIKDSNFSLNKYYEDLTTRYLTREFHEGALRDQRKTTTTQYTLTDRDVIKYSYESSTNLARDGLYLCSFFQIPQ